MTTALLLSLISPERIKRDDFLTQTRAALHGIVDPRRAWHGNLATWQPAKAVSEPVREGHDLPLEGRVL